MDTISVGRSYEDNTRRTTWTLSSPLNFPLRVHRLAPVPAALTVGVLVGWCRDGSGCQPALHIGRFSSRSSLCGVWHMPYFSSSCFCGLLALSCAGGAPSRAIGSRLRSSVLLAAATGGRGFNKARLKVRDFFLLCYLFATSLPLAGHGGEGMGWEAAAGS